VRARSSGGATSTNFFWFRTGIVTSGNAIGSQSRADNAKLIKKKLVLFLRQFPIDAATQILAFMAYTSAGKDLRDASQVLLSPSSVKAIDNPGRLVIIQTARFFRALDFKCPPHAAENSPNDPSGGARRGYLGAKSCARFQSDENHSEPYWHAGI
jgi:hypothetical protein